MVIVLILVIVNGYKNINNDYIFNGFIHARIKEYQAAGIDVQVFECCPSNWQPSYNVDGVYVTVGNSHELSLFIDTHKPNAIAIHFINKNMIKGLNKSQYKPDLYIFIHGAEALYWYERIFPKMFPTIRSFFAFFKRTLYNIVGIYTIKRFFKEKNHKITLIGVSKWMLSIAIKNYKCKNINSLVIPNVVRNDIFNFIVKPLEQRFKILVVRSFSSHKYSPDIVKTVIEKLSHYPVFKKIDFLIVGEGIFWEKYTSAISCFSNVSLKKGFISQSEVANLHKSYGIFLCPTRQDAQGVSMCEAMASGLIPITLFNTAIPEFVPSDLECKNINDMVKLIIDIATNSEMFSKYSNLVSSFIMEKCAPEKTTNLEIDLFKNITIISGEK